MLIGSSPALAQKDKTLFDVRWTVSLPGPAAAPYAADDQRVYVPLIGGQLTAWWITDGTEAWRVEAPTNLAVAAGDRHVFIAGDTGIRALDAASGAEDWHVTLGTAVAAAPTFDAGWLFVSTDRQLVALRAADGARIWSLDLDTSLRAPPAPAADRVYVSLSDGRLVALRLQTGDVVWTRSLPTDPPSDILPLDDRLFVGSDDNYLYCLDLRNGATRWTWRTGGDISGAPVVDESRVYFMSRDNVLRAHDRGNGAQRWRQAVPGRTIGGPVRSRDYVVLATLTPQLLAYRRRDGTLAGTSPTPTGDAVQAVLVGPPQMVTLDGADAFVLVTRQGTVELLAYADASEDAETETGEAP